jgi:hypothetical protein
MSILKLFFSFYIITMAKYKHTDNSQSQFMVVNLNEQLLSGTFEWTMEPVAGRK